MEGVLRRASLDAHVTRDTPVWLHGHGKAHAMTHVHAIRIEFDETGRQAVALPTPPLTSFSEAAKVILERLDIMERRHMEARGPLDERQAANLAEIRKELDGEEDAFVLQLNGLTFAAYDCDKSGMGCATRASEAAQAIIGQTSDDGGECPVHPEGHGSLVDELVRRAEERFAEMDTEQPMTGMYL